MKAVGVAELKGNLSKYLRAVRRGHPLVVLDRNTPVAQNHPIPGRRARLAGQAPRRGGAQAQAAALAATASAPPRSRRALTRGTAGAVIAYLDSSVVLRLALSQPDALAEWHAIDEGVTSALTEVECLRTLDRLRLREGLADEQVALRREALYALFATVSVVDLSRPVLDRAAQPLPTSLGTLDAIHLATAQLWRERSAPGLVLATHDAALAIAGRAIGMTVFGVPRPQSP